MFTIISLYIIVLQSFMAHRQPALKIRASVDYSLSVLIQQELGSLLSWVESKPEPVELKRCTPST